MTSDAEWVAGLAAPARAYVNEQLKHGATLPQIRKSVEFVGMVNRVATRRGADPEAVARLMLEIKASRATGGQRRIEQEAP